LRSARLPTACLLAALASPTLGCGEDKPANVAGRYQISLTNGMNGCQLANWQEGNTAQGIALTITQDPSAASKVTGLVEGIPGGLLKLWLGSSTFAGTVHGAAIDMTIFGQNAMTAGSCAYTTNANAQATVDLNGLITGTIRYTYATNKTPDCGYRTGCETRQSFNGTRPPPQ
jgi:hypothetical protein